MNDRYKMGIQKEILEKTLRIIINQIGRASCRERVCHNV